MTLIERLVALAAVWARENDRSLARLATIVVNDGKLFERLAAGATCTITTYERLMTHLSDPTNWSCPIPVDGRRLLAPVGFDHVAHCTACNARAEHPSVRSCTAPDCPMRAREAA